MKKRMIDEQLDGQKVDEHTVSLLAPETNGGYKKGDVIATIRFRTQQTHSVRFDQHNPPAMLEWNGWGWDVVDAVWSCRDCGCGHCGTYEVVRDEPLEDEQGGVIGRN